MHGKAEGHLTRQDMSTWVTWVMQTYDQKGKVQMKRAWKTQDIERGEGLQTAIDMAVLLMNESHRLWYPVHCHRPLSPTRFLPTFATCFAIGTEIMAFEL